MSATDTRPGAIVRRLGAALSLALGLSLAAAAPPARAGTILDGVKARGAVVCGANILHIGFSRLDEAGEWHGMDVDFCRAVAAAVLGDPRRVSFIALSAQTRLTALEQGEVDLLFRTTTWTLGRDAGLPLDFAGVTFYDGQAFMVRRALGLRRITDLRGPATVCVEAETTSEGNLSDFIQTSGLPLTAKVFQSHEEARRAFFTGQCDVYTDDASALASCRASDATRPDDFVILPDRISKEPLGPVVRNDDNAWFDIVKWVVFATIEAEERGITSANAAEMRATRDPMVRRLLGADPGIGAPLGLDDGWVFRIIGRVGNYGEIFARHVGPGTVLALDRGLNDLWTRGGLLYAMPFR